MDLCSPKPLLFIVEVDPELIVVVKVVARMVVEAYRFVQVIVDILVDLEVVAEILVDLVDVLDIHKVTIGIPFVLEALVAVIGHHIVADLTLAFVVHLS